MPDIKGLFLLPASIQESHYISIEELFGPFGSLKPHILYFHASIVEKFEVIEEKCTKPYSLSSVLTYKQIKCGV